jgi:PQQ-dependent dehydrogenase (methanol/ethanol family)
MSWIIPAVLGTLVSGLAAVAFQTPRIDDKALKNAAKGTEWLSYGMDYSEQRYSTAAQINAANVGKLAAAWSYEVGNGGGPQAGTPLYSNGILYVISNWSVTSAVDATTGKEIWRYDPQADRTMTQAGRSRLCCGVNSRGIALYEGKVIVPVIDGRLEAIDAKTGKLIWSVLAIPPTAGGELSSYSITMAPRVANGKVFIGNAGAEFPPYRGYVSAFDVNNGKELWRFYTVPGDPSKKFETKAMEQAAKTWTGEWWKQGGGGSYWDGMAYDPDANLLYVGTGNGAVWSQEVRQGKGTPHLDNLYVASILAINASTGELKWHYQCTPGDQWDYDAISHLMLASLRINGSERKVIMQANKNGYFMSSTAPGDLHLRRTHGTTELGKRHGSQNRPAENQSGSVLRFHAWREHHTGPDAQHFADGVQSRRRPGLCSHQCFRRHSQLYCGGTICGNSGQPEFRHSPWGPGDIRKTAVYRTGAKPAGRQEHSQCMGSRHAEGTMVCGRRRQSIRRCRIDRSQPGVSGYATGTPARLHGGQRREVAGSRHWRNCRGQSWRNGKQHRPGRIRPVEN